MRRVGFFVFLCCWLCSCRGVEIKNVYIYRGFETDSAKVWSELDSSDLQRMKMVAAKAKRRSLVANINPALPPARWVRFVQSSGSWDAYFLAPNCLVAENDCLCVDRRDTASLLIMEDLMR